MFKMVKSLFERLSLFLTQCKNRNLSLFKPARLLAFAFICASLTPLSSFAQSFDPAASARYAGIVIDAQTGEVLYARRADAKRYPASLTKIMTLYMAFEALSDGSLKPDDPVFISSHAAAQPPTKAGLGVGDFTTVDQAMKMIAIHSANDLSAALAETIAGSEERFSALMTLKAHSIGMKSSNFVNASGLPDDRQVSSAQDMALLARVIMRDYPQYYAYFTIPSMNFRGRLYHNHNPVLGMSGVDGLKTGFTRAAGYNLVASQVKNERRLITVMMGSDSKWQRREHVSFLLETGFDVLNRRKNGETIQVAQNIFIEAMQPSTPSETIPYTQFASTVTAGENKDTSGATLTFDAIVSQASMTQPVQTGISYAAIKAKEEEQKSIQTAQALLAQQTTAQNEAKLTSALNQSAQNNQHPQAITLSQNTKDKGLVAALEASKSKAPLNSVAVPSIEKAKQSENKDSLKNDDKKKAVTLKATAASETKEKSTKPDAKSKQKGDWSIQVGAYKSKAKAENTAQSIKSRFAKQLAKSKDSVSKSSEGSYRVRFVELSKEAANSACKALEGKNLDCLLIKP